MTQIKIGYPISYGDELTPEMPRKNRKSIYVYSVLIYKIWASILGLEKDPQHFYSNQDISKIK